MNNILLLISFAVVSIYLTYVVIKYGWQYSFSETYYTIGEKWWFTLILWGWMLPAMIVGIDITDNFILFLGGAAVMFVGAAPAFKIKKSMERKVHMVGSYVAVICSVLSTWVDFSLWWIALLYAITVILVSKDILKIRNKILWIELSAYFIILLILTYVNNK